MHGGIGGVVSARDRVDDLGRFLRGGGGVEIRPAVRDRREIGEQVEGAGVELEVNHAPTSPFFSSEVEKHVPSIQQAFLDCARNKRIG
jgi:hypothetical protein